MSGREFDLEELTGIGRERANDLREAGFNTLGKIRQASVEELSSIPSVSQRLASQMKEELGTAESGDGTPPAGSRDLSTEAVVTGEFEHISEENRKLLDISLRRDLLRRIDPVRLAPILLPPCEVDVLVVTDSTVSFDEQDFALQTFVETILDPPGPYVRFKVTLAHRGTTSFGQALQNHPRVDRTIENFRFNNSNHFGTEMYDQVWLFGYRSSPVVGQEVHQEELRALSEFMDGGGGLFATGDHGALGKGLSGDVPRARSMRLWDNSSGEVAMTDERRNDTNRLGRNMQSEFDDESDDVPQEIDPKMYRTWSGIWRISYPHPLLCGPDGPITVMPDHPHEGECIEPSNTSKTFNFNGYQNDEYPPATGSGPHPLPEIISTSRVPAGNVADTKDPTDAQEFGGICAYDGHRADVGRVVTDATWHHFFNLNLIGRTNPSQPHKSKGFLYSSTGQDHLDDIKRYFRNIAVWLSREEQIDCMNTRTIWDLLNHGRVIEAVSTQPDVTFEMADARYVFDVGRHARDVLGNYASQCQSRNLVIDIIEPHIDKELLDRLDPWRDRIEEHRDAESLPWTNPDPILDLALGGALIALREEFPDPDPEIRDEVEEVIDEVVARGVREALDMALESVDESVHRFDSLWDNSPEPASEG